MKQKIIPVLVVFCLIIIVAMFGVGSFLKEKYTPSDEVMDGKEYFHLEGEDQAALILNGILMEEKVKIVDGKYYIEESLVADYINSRFYWDQELKAMLYTLPTELFQIVPEAKSFETSAGVTETDYIILTSVDDVFYLNLDFVQMYSEIECTVYGNPARVVVRTEWGTNQVVKVKEDAVIREKGGIKSIIIDDVKKGDSLYLLDTLENWAKVATKDGYEGYIQKESISSAEEVVSEYTGEVQEYTSITRDYKINLAWHQVTNMTANGTLDAMVADAKGLNTISPTWFSVTDNDGTISSLASKDYVDKAHQKGLEVWGLIDNFNSSTNSLVFLSSYSARTRIIEQLISEAKRVGLDGINLDFESITVDQGTHFVQFVRELSIACRVNNLVFSIDNPVPMSYNHHYGFEEQGIVADYVIIMGYDEHYSGSETAGSVASIGFVKDGIVGMLEDVPADKVINGVPFYTRLWIESYGGSVSSEILGMDGATRYIEQNGMETYWDTQVGQTVATLEGNQALYTIWVEDEDSIAEKMKLVKEYELAGVASWKLGFERASVWSVISEYLQ